MKKYFVVSDTHSFLTALLKALNDKGFENDNPDHILIICGDLFDRGDESREMFEFVKSLPEDRFIYIKGNHEDLLFDCYNQIIHNEIVSSHHYSNGTVKTIANLSGLKTEDCGWLMYDIWSPLRGNVMDKLPEILEFINKRSVDYVEIGNYILVHGWIPCKPSDANPYHSRGVKYTFDENWRDGNWNASRWINGMEAWRQGIKIEGKTIVCGHWHCSWGWSHLKQDRSEFPPKNKKDFKKSFEPFVEDGIIAIDACTAYSGIVNCIVLEIED